MARRGTAKAGRWAVSGILILAMAGSVFHLDALEFVYFGVNLNEAACSWNFDVFC